MHYLLEGQTSFYEKVWTKLCLETDSQIQSHEHAYLNFNNKGINSQNIFAAGSRALSPSFWKTECHRILTIPRPPLLDLLFLFSSFFSEDFEAGNMVRHICAKRFLRGKLDKKLKIRVILNGLFVLLLNINCKLIT